MLYSNLDHCVSALGIVLFLLPYRRIVGWQWLCESMLLPHSFMNILLCLSFLSLLIHSAMDAFAQTLIKDAVNCDKHSDLQNSVNQLDFEYGLCCRGCLCKHTFSIYPLLCTLTLWMAKQCWWRIWQASLMLLCRAHHKRSVCFCRRLLCRVGQSYGFVIQQLWCRWKDSLNLSI